MLKHHESLHRAQNLLVNPGTTLMDLRRVIVKDRVLTEKLITLIKSYGFPPEAWNVSSAIILLGLGTIRSIIKEHKNSVIYKA